MASLGGRFCCLSLLVPALQHNSFSLQPSWLKKALAALVPPIAANWVNAGLLLFAVPKQKRSLARRKIRFKANALKVRRDIQVCPICGQMKLLNHLCQTCMQRYRDFVRREKEKTINHDST